MRAKSLHRYKRKENGGNSIAAKSIKFNCGRRTKSEEKINK